METLQKLYSGMTIIVRCSAKVNGLESQSIHEAVLYQGEH
jgi:hypothetical protein